MKIASIFTKNAKPKSIPFLLLIGFMIASTLACDVLSNITDQYYGDDPCYRDGNSLRYTGAFLPRSDGWVRVTNTVTLQFNTNCEEVFGYADLVEQFTGVDNVETSTARISFKGTYNHQTLEFEGTVYVDLDVTCTGNCGDPYSFDYPANWNGTHNTGDQTIAGWLDGYGDFKQDQSAVIDGLEYREVPYLDIWPEE